MTDTAQIRTVSEEILLTVMCQDEWYGTGANPENICVDEATITETERGDPVLRVTVSAELDDDRTQCFRCDDVIPANPRESNTLAFNQETGFVYACDDCFEVAKERDTI